ncbi:unnamed protein product [Orchesella dallaii]|uniref:SET domain-containing protein n=1 Tax=Orchesella dallaii TaxID=48710 RepID=A0ABP1RTI0_9HEXA
MGKKKRSKKVAADDDELTGTGTCEASADEVSLPDPTELGNVLQYENGLLACAISPIYGRYLSTQRNVKKGDLLFSEKYLIAGPQRSSDVVCVGCHSEFQEDTTRFNCPHCQWPICRDECAVSIYHKDECKFFTEKKIKPPTRQGTCDFGALTILRGLMLKLRDPVSWKKLMHLEAHNDIRKNLPLWRENMINVVIVILDQWHLFEYFSEEEIHTVCGILEVNSFELGEKYSFRGIFPMAAMMAHDCIPNTTHFQNGLDGILEVRAAIDIPAGSPLAICYAFSLEGTSQRRKMLQETKFFECSCVRCCDAKELGTCLSGVLCQTCKKGYVYNTGAADLANVWICEKCKIKVPLQYIDSLLENWQEAVDRVVDIPSSEKFIENCKTVFHPNHAIPFGVKFNLCQAYGRESTELQNLSPADLDRKLALCREVLDVLDALTPGYTITRGMVLYELQAAEIIHVRRLQATLKPHILRRKLQLTLKTLKDAIAILEMSPTSTIEYEIAQSAKKETLVDLTKWISLLK